MTDAVRNIRSAIFHGELRPGQPIRETNTTLATSRTPLRAAMALLMDEGLLEKRGTHTYIREPSQAEVTESVTLRYQIESVVVTLLANRLPHERQMLALQMSDIHERMKQRVDEACQWNHLSLPQQAYLLDQFVDLDVDFHSMLAELAGQSLSAKLLRELRQRVRVFIVQGGGATFDHARMLSTYDQHTAILKAISDSRPTAARHAVFMHITSVASMAYKWVVPHLEQLVRQLQEGANAQA